MLKKTGYQKSILESVRRTEYCHNCNGEGSIRSFFFGKRECPNCNGTGSVCAMCHGTGGVPTTNPSYRPFAGFAGNVGIDPCPYCKGRF
jgi:DnaJ-class molecular chaperone